MSEVVAVKRSNKTLRRNVDFWRSSYSKSTTIECGRDIKNGEIPVTIVDSFFEGTFVGSKLSGYLNTSSRWEDVVDLLESECISKSKSFDKYHGVIKTYYHVPIIGYSIDLPSRSQFDRDMQSLFEDNERKLRLEQSNYLSWKGVYYDPSFLFELTYTYTSEKIKKLCPRTTPLPVFEERSGSESQNNMKKITELKFTAYQSNCTRKRVTCAINHKSHNISGCGWKQVLSASRLLIKNHTHSKDNNNISSFKSPTIIPRPQYTNTQRSMRNNKNCLEINLGREQYVTHFSTAGQYPITTQFPNSEEVPRGYYNRIQVIDNNYYSTPNYVTAFNLYYFSSTTKSWIKLSDSFQGNSDATSEVCHSLHNFYNSEYGLYTRCLRIEPLSFIGKVAALRLSVYGIESKHESDHNSNNSISQEEETPTIHYTVTPAVPNIHNRMVQENKYYGHHWRSPYWNGEMGEKHKRRQVFKKVISNDFKHYKDIKGSKVEQDEEEYYNLSSHYSNNKTRNTNDCELDSVDEGGSILRDCTAYLSNITISDIIHLRNRARNTNTTFDSSSSSTNTSNNNNISGNGSSIIDTYSNEDEDYSFIGDGDGDSEYVMLDDNDDELS